MITPIELKQLRAYGNQDGAILALVWTLSFAATVTEFSPMLSSLLLLSTPLVMFWRLRRFRQDALADNISFLRALYYTLHTYICATILFAAVQFIYFNWLDHGHFFQMLDSYIVQATPIYKQAGVDVGTLKGEIGLMRQLTPIQLCFNFATMHFFWGLILSPIVALAGKKTVKQ